MSDADAGSRRRLKRMALVPVLALATAVISAPAVLASDAFAATVRASVASPLESGVTTSDLSSVAFPMGNLAQSENMFWELFLQSAPGAPWRLRTPPGVASNGGLTVSLAPQGPVTVGFLPSVLLHFSPIARSDDGGSGWSPGVLPDSLASAPDALATFSAGASATSTVAVVSTGSGQRVLTGQGVGGWHTLVTEAALARTVLACGVVRITAVSSLTGTTGAVTSALGVQCAKPGRIGVLVPPASGSRSSGSDSASWSIVGPRLPGSDGSAGLATVLRLESSSVGLIGLAEVRSVTATALVAFWRSSPTAPWALSPPLRVPSGWTERASATGGSSGAGEAVLLGSGATRRVVEIAGPVSSWVTLPAPPARTEALTVRGDVVDAFSVASTKVQVWTSSAGATAWQRTQTIAVPVPFGSSS